MSFDKEQEFENSLIQALTENGWEKDILKYPSQQELLQNWANILFENNRDIDRLNDFPLTESEMQQIIEIITKRRTPLKLNEFINGKTVEIKRDNPDDIQHFGKIVSLKIYDRNEIAAGQSRYQIARQPQFTVSRGLSYNRRGDLMLLINGMPVFHIELKKSGVPISQAYNQIERYASEGAYSGIFSLVQIFFAMNPEETVYFANPGPGGKFNPSYYFHWADFNNEKIDNWKKVASTILSIPMAHQLIGFYTVADKTDGVLKVMRSYQYYAASQISDKVTKTKWKDSNQRGGYIWHTTGSGKTMTSFKSAQLISASGDADKVVFLVDRVELSDQSLARYKGFASDDEEVQETEHTNVLITKLKSTDTADTLIVTSIQKMKNLGEEADQIFKISDLEKIKEKRIVFIVDECHRSTFGEMMSKIKRTFPNAIFFGFSGTPIQDENQIKGSDTATIFGDELHRYSIADGIRDKNVLGFDPYKVCTYRDMDLKKCVALEKSRAASDTEAINDPTKSKVFYKYLNKHMAGRYIEDKEGNRVYETGIEDYISDSQYERKEHQKAVVQDIKENWITLSHNRKFHAIFATSSISEAIQYYRLIKEMIPEMNVAAIFDENISNNGHDIEKEDGLEEIVSDYKARYEAPFAEDSFPKIKKDIKDRLTHNHPYERLEFNPDQQIDLLIVVDQMLTGFDSKWINTLYLDKILRSQNIIQAFSRTNRIFGPEKPFGTIRYYRKPHTMERLIDEAVKLYSGDRPYGLFVEKLDKNLEGMNFKFQEISDLFDQAGILNFEVLPSEITDRKKSASLFKQFNEYLEAAKVQGFDWNKSRYSFNNPEKTIDVSITEVTYKILLLRYKELFSDSGGGDGGFELPYEIDSHLTTISTEDIDINYMNARFEKYLKVLHQDGASSETIKKAEDELHKTFATLTQEEQKYANILLHDIQSGDFCPESKKNFRDYITEYLYQAKEDQIQKVIKAFGVDESQLRRLLEAHVTEDNINEYGRFDALKKTMNIEIAKEFLRTEGFPYNDKMVRIKVDKQLRNFILTGKFTL